MKAVSGGIETITVVGHRPDNNPATVDVFFAHGYAEDGASDWVQEYQELGEMSTTLHGWVDVNDVMLELDLQDDPNYEAHTIVQWNGFPSNVTIYIATDGSGFYAPTNSAGLYEYYGLPAMS
ncbi:hypothetical protein [Maricaulis maris]|uniref:hypothetical protein n=1 Tax=Maricaulis maris TaxID=74318 RepID=UPI0030C6B695